MISNDIFDFFSTADTDTVYSREVATQFGKKHSEIMNTIKNLEYSDEFKCTNYGLTPYDKNGKICYEYVMTRQGYMRLAMELDGPAATQFKIQFIQKYNSLAAELSCDGFENIFHGVI